jgi:hypothetical protein
MDQRNGPAAKPAVNLKVGIESQDDGRVMDFTHSHQAGIGKRGRHIAVAFEQGGNSHMFLLQREIDANAATLDQLQYPHRRTGNR